VTNEVAAQLGNYPELGRKAAQAMPRAKLIELENVGHVPHFEAPAKFHEELIRFVSQPAPVTDPRATGVPAAPAGKADK